jgi:thioredoxin-related protein
MKIIFSLSLILVAIAAQAQQIKWMSMNEALEAQKEDAKKIMVDVYTTWCKPCKILDKKTFQHPKLVKYVNENFYAVKFNAEGKEKVTYQGFTYTNPNYVEGRGKNQRNNQHLFAHAMKVNAYPTIVFFDEESNLISPVKGYKTPKQLEIYLKMIAKDDYKEVTTKESWKKYKDNFESSF